MNDTSSFHLESDSSYNRLLAHPLFHQLQDNAEKLRQELTSSILAVRPPEQSRHIEYQELMTRFESMRGTSLFYPYIGSGLGNGPYVLLEDGSIKLDFICGIGPHYWGHGSKEYLQEMLQSLFFNDTVMQGNLQPNRDCYELIALLTECSGFDHCFISTSGAMAGENAIKVIFHKAHPKNRIFAFERAFAGRSLAMAQITDKASYRKGLPHLLFVDYIPFYDEALGPEKSYEQTIAAIDDHMSRYPDDYAAICCELIQGEGGFRVGHPEYFRLLFGELKKRGLLIWADEVQTFARTSELFAAQAFGCMDLLDVITIGKVSLACATLFRAELKPSPGLLSQTFTASSSAFTGALWGIQKAIQEGHYGPQGKVNQLYSYFSSKLQELSQKMPGHIRGPWGIGSMVSFTPFEGEAKATIQFAKRLFHNGLIGFTCGASPTKIRFLLPVGAITEAHIDEAMGIIEKTLREHAQEI